MYMYHFYNQNKMVILLIFYTSQNSWLLYISHKIYNFTIKFTFAYLSRNNLRLNTDFRYMCSTKKGYWKNNLEHFRGYLKVISTVWKFLTKKPELHVHLRKHFLICYSNALAVLHYLSKILSKIYFYIFKFDCLLKLKH